MVGRPDVELLSVVTGEDKNVGRHRTLTPPKTKTLALAHGVPVLQPKKIATAVPAVAALSPDLVVVMAYGALLPDDLLATPAIACINLHGSLLPRHRGASPVQAAIDAGDTESGITVMHVAKKLDAGDIILKKSIPLSGDETGGSLHDRLAELAPVALGEALDQFLAGTATRTVQDPAQVTYLGKLARADGLIDWSLPAGQLERQIRAYFPWPGSYTTLDSRRLKILPPTQAGTDPHNAPPGTVLDATRDTLRIACGDGSSISLTNLQPDGKKAMPVAAFLAGHSLQPGTAFS